MTVSFVLRGLLATCVVSTSACTDPPAPRSLGDAAGPRNEAGGGHPGRVAPHRPTQATLLAVDALPDPLEVGIFVDDAREGLREAKAYFGELVRQRDDVQLVELRRDSGLTPRFAGSRPRGVVLRHGTQQAHIELVRFANEGADAHVRAGLKRIARAPVQIVATGDGFEGAGDAIARIVASFGTTLVVVDDDAELPPCDLLLLVQRGPLSPTRAEQILDHLGAAGALVFAFEPEAATSSRPVLDRLGVRVLEDRRTPNAPDTERTVTADRINPHGSVHRFLRLGRSATLTLVDPLPLSARTEDPTSVVLTVQGEDPTQDWGWVAAVVSETSRAVVLGDADALGAERLRTKPSHGVLLRDAIAWTTQTERR